MRRSGSSSCLLRPKRSLSTDDLAAAAGTPTATILTREKSDTTCAQDRLHLLAELQAHAHSIHFLESDDLVRGADLPPSVILYLEWDPRTCSPQDFTNGALSDSVKKILSANGDYGDLRELENAIANHRTSPNSSPRRREKVEDSIPQSSSAASIAIESESSEWPRIYAIVDETSSRFPTYPSIEYTQEDNTRYSTANIKPIRSVTESIKSCSAALFDREDELKLAETLVRAVSSKPFLRSILDGITVGVSGSSSIGLEAVVATLAHGSKERRTALRGNRSFNKAHDRITRTAHSIQSKDPEMSSIAVIALNHDSLETNDHHSHHDVTIVGSRQEELEQCRVIAEWHGKGDRVSFAARAQLDWRNAWDTQERTGIASELEVNDEPLSSVMIAILMIAIIAHAWNEYGHIVKSFIDDNL